MTNTETSDADLVLRIANGDTQALSSLYTRHCPKLLALASAMLGNASEAEDLLHDVFLEVWRHAIDYSAQRGSVRAWLVTRTRSRALDRIRSASRRRNVPASEAPDPGAPAPQFDDHDRLRQTLMQMPETQREVVLLAYFEDLSSAEIAEQLSIPVGTVKSRMRAALSALRRRFVEEPSGD